LKAALKGVDAVFICVGTPGRPEDGTADLTFVDAAAAAVGAALRDYAVVIVKSTAPIGTCDAVEKIIAGAAAGRGFAVASNPEFLREGAAISDFMKPDRIVVGVEDERAKAVMAAIYKPLTDAGAPILFMRRRSAELTKYAANVFLAMKVTFINEIADLCEAVGGEISDVADGIGRDPRIGRRFLNAGPGFGGSCFPKDTVALTRIATQARSPMRLVETLVDVNVKRKLAMAEKVVKACGGDVAGKTIGVLGLTYKPHTDDMRDAPSLTIVPALQKKGAKLIAYDPEGMANAAPLLPGLMLAETPEPCFQGVDAVVVITEWEAFRALDFAKLKPAMRTPIIVDLRNALDHVALGKLGFRVTAIGKGA
jgi:UDPglucose 6-dehydrogenase